MQTEAAVPSPTLFTSAPVRNRLRAELNAPVSEVWAIVGDFARLPEYSSGLERVEVRRNEGGAPAEYTCYFKPTEGGGPGAVARDLVRWYEPNRGWASVEVEPNDFGIRNSLHVVTLSPSDRGTLVEWVARYDADDLEMNRTELDRALADIAARLIAQFGGRILERYAQDAP